MCLSDPRQVVIGDGLFSSQVTSDQMHGQVDVHVRACVNTRNHLNDAAQERVATTAKGLEANLLTRERKIRPIKEPQALWACP